MRRERGKPEERAGKSGIDFRRDAADAEGRQRARREYQRGEEHRLGHARCRLGASIKKHELMTISPLAERPNSIDGNVSILSTECRLRLFATACRASARAPRTTRTIREKAISCP